MIRTTIEESCYSRTCDSVKDRCMEMSDGFCVTHLKYLDCVSLHIVESPFVIESLVKYKIAFQG